MAKLIYSAITSLDGYTVDSSGSFAWSQPDEEVHAFINEQERSVGTYLYGRRLYEVMLAWETMDLTDEPLVIADFASLWKAADKIVYSRSLTTTSSAQTTIHNTFDPDAIRSLKESSKQDLSIGGATLASEAIRAGLVDEFHVYLNPIVVGGGTPWLPADVHLPLTLIATHHFTSGVVHLHYRTPHA